MGGEETEGEGGVEEERVCFGLFSPQGRFSARRKRPRISAVWRADSVGEVVEASSVNEPLVGVVGAEEYGGGCEVPLASKCSKSAVLLYSSECRLRNTPRRGGFKPLDETNSTLDGFRAMGAMGAPGGVGEDVLEVIEGLGVCCPRSLCLSCCARIGRAGDSPGATHRALNGIKVLRRAVNAL